MKSLRSKFIATMLLVTGLVGVATLVLVTILNTRASSQYLNAVRTHIEDGIKSKGRVLTENHALAMRSLVLDNAYLDMQRLVERAVKEDTDLVYGLYVSSEGKALAYWQRGGSSSADKLVDKDVWRPLGLSEADLAVPALQIREANRLGETLLEVASPVQSDDGERLGTIRYGLSTKRMQAALEAAQLDAKVRLERSLLMIGGIVGVCTLLGLLLSRVQAVRITRPVSDLTAAAERLAGGDRSVKVDIRSRDELEVLGASFNKMVQDLATSYNQLEDMNRTLEQKVQQRTAELGTKNRDMRLVLDNVDQGFITLAPNGSMAAERSRVVDDWFGADRGQSRTFWDFLAPHSEAFALSFHVAWDQLSDGFLPLEVAIDQLPAQLVLTKKTFSLRYLPFMRDGEFEGVLVVVADVTEKLLKEREDAEQGELMQGFKRLMLDRSGFSNFLSEATEMVEQIQAPEHPDMTLLKRTLHTLKGNSAMMGLVVVARLCHTLEDQLAETGEMSAETRDELVNRWKAIGEHISSFVGNNKQRVIEIPQSEYAALVSRLSAQTDREVLNELLSWQLEPIATSFGRLSDQVHALARRLGKGEVNVVIDAPGVRIEPDVWSPFFSTLVHLVRNALDHGIEPAEQRLAAGKAAAGTVLFRASPGPNTLTIEVSDDGTGIDWDRIARKGEELGLPVGTHQELLAALMHDGVSTKSDISEVSGRGIGMSALRARVEEMGGTIDVRSARNVGTTWVIQLPWAGGSRAPSTRPRRSMPPRTSIAPASVSNGMAR
ncbi:MAG TPA: ATP-binding protein [Polyangiaceae bacterium]|nr:ATP-binding protein [Polyangiaceae bacterium]